jgi:hypothetical protein
MYLCISLQRGVTSSTYNIPDPYVKAHQWLVWLLYFHSLFNNIKRYLLQEPRSQWRNRILGWVVSVSHSSRRESVWTCFWFILPNHQQYQSCWRLNNIAKSQRKRHHCRCPFRYYLLAQFHSWNITDWIYRYLCRSWMPMQCSVHISNQWLWGQLSWGRGWSWR